MTLTRRHVLGGAVAGMALSGNASILDAARGPDVVRHIPHGKLRGQRIGGVDRFLGIPFAAPPVGELRFLAPRPLAAWEGIREADRFAAAPMQAPAAPSIHDSHPPRLSEDCLYLNVWSPRSPGPHPVYVWVHGGGNVAGSSSMAVFDGAAFARDGIVCVTLTYRVGSFGFLELGDLLGPDYAGSGNNGLRDLMAGLEWVRRSIADFGGDPDNVTLGGQSAGAKNVVALMAIPSARRLFRRAIVESGGGHTASTLATANDLARRILSAAALPGAAALLAAPADVIVAAQRKVTVAYPRKYPFRAVLDHDLLGSVPAEAIASGVTREVPMLIGTTRDENAFFGPAKTPDGGVIQAEVANMDIGRFNGILARYPAAFPAMDHQQHRYHALTAEEYWIPTLRLAQAHAAAGGHNWLYRFDLAPEDGAFRDLAIHGSELALVWDKLADPLSSYLGPTGPAAAAISRKMHGCWVNFIRHGKPVTSPETWPRFEPERPATMVFDRQARMNPDIDPVGRRLWKDWHPGAFDLSAENG